jgi:hypothetical protein
MAAYSIRKIRSCLAAVDNAATADAKGDALEELGRYLFEKMAGVTCEDKNILDGRRAHELDLAFFNDQTRSPISFLDAVIIVECKASGNPVGSDAVRWFVGKLRDRGSHHGILIALNGITGENDPLTSAHSEVFTALSRDMVRILILTREEIESLSCAADLAALFKRKLMVLTLKRTVHIAG